MDPIKDARYMHNELRELRRGGIQARSPKKLIKTKYLLLEQKLAELTTHTNLSFSFPPSFQLETELFNYT